METVYMRDVILKRYERNISASVAFKMWGVEYMKEADLRRRFANSATSAEAHPAFRENQRRQRHWAMSAPELNDIRAYYPGA
jgi:hypothetical protein